MELALLIAGSLFVAGFIMGISGFGFAIVAIGMMSFFLPLNQTVALIFVYALPINLVLLYQLRAHVAVRRVWPQVVAFLPGMIIGAFLFLHVEEAVLKQIVGIILILFAIWSLWNRKPPQPASSLLFAQGAGFLAGILGGAVYMPGPPIIVYNTMTMRDRFQFKADLQTFFVFTNGLLLFVFLYCGLFEHVNFLRSLSFAPAAGVGLAVGTALFTRVDNDTFKKIISVLLGVMGVILIVVNK
jgi:uncharacterized membrane protein YfcA